MVKDGSRALAPRESSLLAVTWFLYVLCIGATGLGLQVGQITVRPEHLGLILLLPLILLAGRSDAHPRGLVYVGLVVWVLCALTSSVLFAVEPFRSLYIVALIIGSLVAMTIVAGTAANKAWLVQVGTWAVAAVSVISLVAYLVAGDIVQGGFLVTFDSDGVTKRLVGLAFEPNIMGSFTALWVALVVYYRAQLTLPVKLITSVIVLASVLTLTRAAWVSLAITLVYVLITSLRSIRALITSVAAVSLGLVATIAILASRSDSDVWLKRLSSVIDLGSGTGAFRVTSWSLAMEDFATHSIWVLGLGSNSFQQRHIEQLATNSIDYFSNAWLAQLHDAGILGLIGFLTGVAMLWVSARRRLDALPLFVTLGITATLTNPLWFAYPWVVLALLDFSRRERADGTRRARIYPMARVAHLERQAKFVPADLLFTANRLDWDASLASSEPGVIRLPFSRILARVWRYDVIELPEPLAVSLTPHLLALVTLVRLGNLARRTPTVLVTYAIENLDQIHKVVERSKLPMWLARPALRFCWIVIISGMSRMAFGTHGAMENYRACVGPGWDRTTKRTELRLFPALPSAAAETGPKTPLQACFLGGFQTNKGVLQLTSAWPLVLKTLPEARLSILGQGAQLEQVRVFAESDATVELQVAPDRSTIRSVLRASVCLILLSRRTPTFREQVGLPIVEGLEQGCEIVTTWETGLAQWLADNGHTLVDDPDSPEAVAAAIIRALTSGRDPEDIVAVLPSEDARLAADRWMFR